MDTVGEFVLGVGNRDFPFPAILILPGFRPIARPREFANSISRVRGWRYLLTRLLTGHVLVARYLGDSGSSSPMATLSTRNRL